MKKTILVATDFSPVSENATHYAVDMAMAINADILLTHIYQLPVNYGEVVVAIDTDEIIKDCKDELEIIKNKLLKKTSGKIKIETDVRAGVIFQDELRNICDEAKPHVVIMGAQGKTAAEHLVYGTHAAYAIRHLMYPLITVPQEAKFSSIKKIGLACDLTKVTDTIPAEEIKKLVHELNAELHILNIDRLGVFNPKTDYDSVLLERMMASLKPTYHFITDQNTDKAIIKFVDDNHIDLLIVVPKRMGLVKRLIHKSHTRQLVLHSYVPVMAMHYQPDKSYFHESIHQEI